MKYIKFGRTGLEVSPLCLGCMTYGTPDRGAHAWTLDEAASRPLIKQALELGINFLDTANVYSDGTSVEIVGRAIREVHRTYSGAPLIAVDWAAVAERLPHSGLGRLRALL